MLSPSLLSSLSAVTLVSLAGVGHANTVRHYTGQECQPIEPVDAARIANYADGCSNPGGDGSCATRSTIANVSLPISGNQSDNVDYDEVRVNYLDNHHFDQVACQIVVVNAAASSYYSSSKGSGIDTEGSGTFVWAGTELPNNGVNVPGTRSQYIYCGIPSRFRHDRIDGVCQDQGFSYVHNYRVNAVNP